jgi:hypothetical protein
MPQSRHCRTLGRQANTPSPCIRCFVELHDAPALPEYAVLLPTASRPIDYAKYRIYGSAAQQLDADPRTEAHAINGAAVISVLRPLGQIL